MSKAKTQNKLTEALVEEGYDEEHVNTVVLIMKAFVKLQETQKPSFFEESEGPVDG